MEKNKFVELIADNQGMILKVCKVYRDTAEDREDLFQDIILELWKSIESFKQESKLSTWIYRIALNTAIARYRSGSSKIRYQTISKEELNISVKPKESAQEEAAVILYAAINKLNTIEKAIILLYLEERSYQEMASILGLSESNISVKLTRIRKKLKDILNPVSNGNNRLERSMANGQ